VSAWFFIFMFGSNYPTTFGPFATPAECERIRKELVEPRHGLVGRAFVGSCYRGRLLPVVKATK